MHKALAVAAATVLLGAGASARAQPSSAEQRFRELYKELVETNTSLSAGSCTLAAERMAARLKASGYTDEELHLFTAPGHPKEGGLVAVYPGRDTKLKAILLLAHLDVVEAKREDWTRDPFTLVEENGNFYARGAVDDKAEGAIWVDTLARFREENYRPLRTVKLALTCGEETSGALKKIEAYTFPAQFTDGNRAYFTGMAKIQAGRGEAAIANAMRALVRDPADEQAIALVSAKDPGWNATLRTTCVATMLEAGH